LEHIDFFVQLLRNGEFVHSFLFFQSTTSFDGVIPILQIAVLGHFVSEVVDTEYNAPYKSQSQEIHQNAVQVDMHCDVLGLFANNQSDRSYRNQSNQNYQCYKPFLNHVQSNYVS